MSPPRFYNPFTALLTPQSYKGLGMSQFTSAQEAKSNQARVSPQPNRNKRAGTLARSTMTPAAKRPTAVAGTDHENGQSPGNRSNQQASASPIATCPAPPGKGKATQGAATSGNVPGNGSNTHSSASSNMTRPAPLAGKGKATQGAATSGRGRWKRIKHPAFCFPRRRRRT
ncbi:hypothetical protein DFP72DRAFT_428076 [Ephemerocybe angulata]|uniref:Uncharacterized protein n=1 Tax=Ephemerocybe angulata TaxID=980116 RepID=A0A8H6M6M7_9AGAR|nr:hypothetical protein DFP72DRAFT_428076 [Tulosesus angulatus]